MTPPPKKGLRPTGLLEKKKLCYIQGAHACNLSTWKLKTGGSPIHNRSRLGSETLSQNKGAGLLEISLDHKANLTRS